jgi:hypothetical protein
MLTTNYALQGHPVGPKVPSAEAGSSIVDED